MKVKAVIFFVITLFLMLAVLSYNKLDAAVLAGGFGGSIHNWIGHAGAWSSVILSFHTRLDAVAGGVNDTLAGLLLEIKGEFPKLHETIVCNGVAMEVEKKDKHRIVKIKVTLPVTDVAGGEDD